MSEASQRKVLTDMNEKIFPRCLVHNYDHPCPLCEQEEGRPTGTTIKQEQNKLKSIRSYESDIIEAAIAFMPLRGAKVVVEGWDNGEAFNEASQRIIEAVDLYHKALREQARGS